MTYDSQNIFAKILRGEASCIKLFEDAQTLAFMDIMPQAAGHALIIPKEAAETLLDLSEESAQACIRTTQRIARAIAQALDRPDLFICQLNGKGAGQTVPHCHFHVIPRNVGTPWVPHASVLADVDELETIAARIRACL